MVNATFVSNPFPRISLRIHTFLQVAIRSTFCGHLKTSHQLQSKVKKQNERRRDKRKLQDEPCVSLESYNMLIRLMNIDTYCTEPPQRCICVVCVLIFAINPSNTLAALIEPFHCSFLSIFWTRNQTKKR